MIRQIFVYILFFIIISFVSLVLVYNLSGHDIFPLKTGKYLSIGSLLLLIIGLVHSLGNLFKSINIQDYWYSLLWIVLSIIIMFIGIVEAIIIFIHFGIIGNYIDGGF